MHHIEISEKYEHLAEMVMEEHPDLHWIRQAGINICYLESDQEKVKASGAVLGECRLVTEPWQVFCPYDFLIIIYLPNVIHLNEEQEKILLYHELLHVDVTEKDGEPKYRVAPHDIEDFKRVIDQYGVRWAGV